MSAIVVSVPYRHGVSLEVINGKGPAFACSDFGCGEPVIALHCYASSGRQWRPLADEAAMVRTLAAQNNEPVHWIGHSYGGGVAQRAALQAPEPVRSLTLVEPAARAGLFRLFRHALLPP